MSAEQSYIENYRQIKHPQKFRIRNFIRKQALNVLSVVGNDSIVSSPHVQFLYFHHVFQDECKKMQVLIDKLSKKYHFLSYTEAVTRINTGDIDRPYLCFSSDDGFKNNLNSADIFKSYGISCCYFLCPAFVGETSFTKVAEISRTTFHLPPVEFLTWTDVELLQKQGHEIGNHTLTHQRLSLLQDDKIEMEITQAHDMLKARCGDIHHFAYPYGGYKDITSGAKKLVFDLGYTSCASAVRGAYVPGNKAAGELIKRDPVIFYKKDHLSYFSSRNLRQAVAMN